MVTGAGWAFAADGADPDQAAFLAAQGLARSGDDVGAAAAFLAIATAHPTSAYATHALYSAGDHFERAGRLGEATRVFAAFVAQHPTAPEAPAATFRRATDLVREGDFSAAIVAFDDYLRQYPDAPDARSALWNASEFRSVTGDAAGGSAGFERYATQYPGADDADATWVRAGRDATWVSDDAGAAVDRRFLAARPHASVDDRVASLWALQRATQYTAASGPPSGTADELVQAWDEAIARGEVPDARTRVIVGYAAERKLVDAFFGQPAFQQSSDRILAQDALRRFVDQALAIEAKYKSPAVSARVTADIGAAEILVARKLRNEATLFPATDTTALALQSYALSLELRGKQRLVELVRSAGPAKVWWQGHEVARITLERWYPAKFPDHWHIDEVEDPVQAAATSPEAAAIDVLAATDPSAAVVLARSTLAEHQSLPVECALARVLLAGGSARLAADLLAIARDSAPPDELKVDGVESELLLDQAELMQADWWMKDEGIDLDARVAADARGVLAKAPDDLVALQVLGALSLRAHDYTGAAALFEHADRLRPESAAILDNLAIAHRGQGRFADARTEYERANALDPADWRAWHNLAVLYTESLPDYRAVRLILRDHPEAGNDELGQDWWDETFFREAGSWRRPPAF